MPNLAFSPGPQQPPQPDQDGGEKENASAPPQTMSGAGATKKVGGMAPTDRHPLEILPTAAAASGAVVCKRDSSCKCPDCDMAASVFGIDELRRVGGGGGGGLARSPVASVRSDDVDNATADSNVGTEDSPVASSPLVDSNPAAAVSSHDYADGSQTTDARHVVAAAPPATPGAVAPPTPAAVASASPTAALSGDNVPPSAATVTATSPNRSAASGEEISGSPVEKQASQDLGERQAATPTGDGGGSQIGTPASGASGKSEGSKKKGWGFRMARAVFSPRTTKPKKQQAGANGSGGGAGGGGGAGATATTAFADELTNEAAAATAEGDSPRSAEAAKGEPAQADNVAQQSAPAAVIASGGCSEVSAGMGGPVEGDAAGDDDPLFGDQLAEDGECKEERRTTESTGSAGVDERDAAPGSVTCKPPLLPRGRDRDENVGEKDVAVAADPATVDGPDRVSGEVVLTAAAAAGSMKRSASGRRLSKDVFFECSTEVEHVLTSDSDSDREACRRASITNNDSSAIDHTENEQAAAPPSSPLRGSVAAGQDLEGDHAYSINSTTTTSNANSPTSTKARAPLTPTTTFASGGGGVGALAESAAMPISPVVEANSPAAVAEVAAAPDASAGAAEAADASVGNAGAGGNAPESEMGATDIAAVEGGEGDAGAPAVTVTHSVADKAPAPLLAPSPEGGENNVTSMDAADGNDVVDDSQRAKSRDDNQNQEEGLRIGVGRRRNRRQAPQLELGMAAAYGHEHDRAKFSQAEVDAKIKERLAEEQAAFEKTVSAMKAAHEAELQAAADKLQQSSSDGNRAKIAARDAEALEREIAMLSERYGEAAAEAKTNGKALLEKEALLDAVTAQLMGLKTDLAAARAEHAADKQAMSASADEERRARSLAEGNLHQLEAAYNKLEDSEREKRAAGILKMKNDMKALAQQQFAEANKKHAALKARLERSEAQARLMGEAAKEDDAKAKAAAQKAEALRAQVETLKKAQADSAASAARREQLLEEEVRILREEAESRLDEVEAMARERDSANNGREVSQDALARMAIRNTQMKESVADLEGKVKELEGFCTEALDELDAEKAKNAQLLSAAGGN